MFNSKNTSLFPSSAAVFLSVCIIAAIQRVSRGKALEKQKNNWTKRGGGRNQQIEKQFSEGKKITWTLTTSQLFIQIFYLR